MEVLWVLVEDEAAEFLHGEFVARPDLGDVERIEAEFVWIAFLRLHYLYHGSPLGLFSCFNGIPKIALRIVRIFSRDADCFRFGELLRPMLGNEVVLDVDKFGFLVDPENS